MKIQSMRPLLFIGILFHSAILGGQTREMDLYLQPDIQSQRIASAGLGDPRLGQPLPVMDEAKAALGWHYAEFRGTVEAYVEDAKIGKNLLPVENAMLHARPSSDSPVLGVYQVGNAINVLDTGPWWTLRVETAFPVYFVMDAPPPLPPVTGSFEDRPTIAPDRAEPPSTRPVEERGVTQAAPPSHFPAIPESLKPAQPQPEVLGQSYEGTFKRAKRVFGLFAPKSPFFLEDIRGNRIAWVDTKHVVIPGTLNDYLDKQVIIHGGRDFDASSKEWIIRALNMRLK